MPRLARIVAVGVPHHVTQRGNARRHVFFSDQDRRVYLQLLHEQAVAYDLDILGHCLMSNHVHIIGVPRRDDSMALTFRYTHGRYATYLNAQQARSGHVWQSRYYSCPLDIPHLWQTLRYIELNPVRAGLVAAPAEWPWSSAAYRLSNTVESEFLNLDLWRSTWTPKTWRAFLSQGTSLQEANAIRRNTHSGRPLGSRHFVGSLELRLGRILSKRSGANGRRPSQSDQGSLWPIED